MSENYVNCIIKKEITITLEVSQDAASWLKANLQNPLHGQNPHEETDEDSEFRHLFWEALEDVS